MEISSLIDFYIDPAGQAPQKDLKLMKAPDCDQDVQRFESILKGEGPYQPKTLDLVIPGTEPNAIQNVSNTVLDKVATVKSSVDNRMDRIDAHLDKMKGGDITLADSLQLQYELCNLTVETQMLSKSSEKASQGLQVLVKGQ